MKGIKNFINQQLSRQNIEEHQAINALLEKLGDGVPVNDQLEALRNLCDQLTDDSAAQSVFSSLGFPALCHVVANNKDNLAVVRTGLECISTVINMEHGLNEQHRRAIAVNSEQFARTAGAVPLLLTLLRDVSTSASADAFHVKYLALQIVYTLLLVNAALSQQAIFSSPTAFSDILDLLDEVEVLRNQAVIILQRLVDGYPFAQRTAGERGCLETLFRIIRDEDFMAGGIIVSDCLILITKLLKDDQLNRELFTASNYHVALGLEFKKELDVLASNKPFSIERGANLAAAIQVLEYCESWTQDSVRAIAAFAAHRMAPSSVRVASWDCLAAVISGQHASSLDLTGSSWLHDIVELSFVSFVNTSNALERRACGDFVAAAVGADKMLQIRFLGELMGANPKLDSLLTHLKKHDDVRHDITASRVAGAIAYMLSGNADNQISLLSARVPQQRSTIMEACTQRLAACITQYGNRAEAQEMVAHYGSLFVAWLPACQPAISDFLAFISKTPFLVGAVITDSQFGANGVIIRGTCAVILGICSLHAPVGSAIDCSTLTNAVATQIGWQKYFEVIDMYYSVLETQKLCNASDLDVILWSQRRAADIQYIVQEVRCKMTMVAESLQSGAGLPSIVPDGETNTLKSAVSKSNTQSRLLGRIDVVTNDTVPVSKEVEALQKEIGALKRENDRFRKEADDAIANSERLQIALAKAEADLEGLSSAYSALETHAAELQTRLDKPELMSHQPDVAILENGNRSKKEIEDLNATLEDLLVCLGQQEARVAQLEKELAQERLK